MESFVLIIHVLIAVAIVGLILLQQGKGAEMGASFGAGSSQTVFGAAGSAGFMVKLTAALAAIFFVTSLTLAIFANKNARSYGVIPDAAPAKVEQAAGDIPAAPAAKTVEAPANTDIPAAPAE